jgi:RNA polymerase sigma-70 factor, ECF subfamily
MVSRWFPPSPTVDADRFQGESDPYPDHWKEFPRPWPVGQAVDSGALRAALAALPDPWRRVVILRDVEGRPAAEVSAATGLSAEQRRDVLNRARELLREDLGRAFEQNSHRS